MNVVVSVVLNIALPIDADKNSVWNKISIAIFLPRLN